MIENLISSPCSEFYQQILYLEQLFLNHNIHWEPSKQPFRGILEGGANQ